MKIERYINDEGVVRCFAVDNTKVSRSGMVKMISSIPGVVITKWPRFFDDDVFCKFTYKESLFIIEEPYGDNTTYDVVAEESGLVALEEIAAIFEGAATIKGGDWGYNSMFLLRVIVAGFIFTALIKWLCS